MNIALISLDQSWENKQANKEKISNIFENISGEKLDWIILPELTLTGFSMNTKDLAEDFDNSETIIFFSELSIKYKVYITFGLIIKSDSYATNNLITTDRIGNIIMFYEKIHPFSYSGENKFYKSGSRISLAIIDKIKVGFSICYDLRFPEIFQIMSKDVLVLVNIANWPEKRIVHWNVLLQARAIENQCFMIGVNRVGIDGNNIKYPKSSAIFNPIGEKLNSIKSYPEVDIYKVDFEEVITIRDSFPTKQDRKLEFYKLFY